MAKKDPAFLFYPEKWLQGTASMMPDEKGVYIDLLSHQHQDGSLPNDTKRLARMCGLDLSEFLRIWEVVGKKFNKSNDHSVDRLVNRKMTEVVTERLTKSLTNKISGQFAALLRTSNFSYEMKEMLKKEFKTDDFSQESDRSVKERLIEWLAVRSKSIININSINVSTVKNSENGQKSETGFSGNFKARGEEVLIKRHLENLANQERNRQKDSDGEDGRAVNL